MAENGRRKGDDALVLALAGGQTVRGAARAAGIGERTATRRVADPDFRHRVSELRARIAEQAQGKVVESMAEAAAGLPAEPEHEPPPPPPPDIGGDLAREAVGAFARSVQLYREHLKATLQEALDQAGDHGPDRVARALSAPPDQVTFIDLYVLAEADPDKAEARWREVRKAAREEVCSGHRAARFIEPSFGECWQRARFLALRAELTDAWRPRDQLEQQLIDQLAQFQTKLEDWQQTLTVYANSVRWDSKTTGKNIVPFGEPPRLTHAKAVDQAAAMVERFHRLFLRTLRTLKDLRHVRTPAGLFGQAGKTRGTADAGRNGGPVLN